MRRSLNTSVIASVVLHVFVFLLSIFGLPWIDKPMEFPEPVPVEIVDMSDMTTRTADANPNPAPKPDKPPEPQKTPPPPPKSSTPPPPQTAPETPPMPKAPPEDIKAPEPPKVEPIQPREAPKPPEPVKPLEPAPAPTPPPPPKPEPKKEEPPKPTPPKPAPAKEEPKKPAEQPKKEQPVKTVEKTQEKPKDKAESFDSVLKNLLNVPDQAKTDQPTKANAKPTQTAEAQPDAPLADRLTVSEEDALRSQIARCWNVPVGARGAEGISVDVAVTMNEDGTVRSATVADRARMLADNSYKVMAESAVRAVLNPACQPFKLPKDKFATWQRFTFVFNPKDMF